MPKKVFWIDIGANDPIFLSVTKFFSMRGGRGINVEPQKDCIDQYELDRKNDINLCVAVGAEKGTLKLYGTGTGASLNRDEVETIGETNCVNVPVRTLKDICEEYVETNQIIHFLKIDVEGFEAQVLRGADFNNYRPWILCIEASEHEWEEELINYGYANIWNDGQNRWYALKEHHEIIERASLLDKFDELYDVTSRSTLIVINQEYQAIKSSNSWKWACKIRKALKGK
ncbi:FkbM family methyltransferase [Butyrivibrio fibrisolvens]|nr:FkbM family methyltransferase [Butyrivibrio fibrisolvens]